MKVLRRKANACHREAKNCEFKFFIEEKLCWDDQSSQARSAQLVNFPSAVPGLNKTPISVQLFSILGFHCHAIKY